MRIAAFVDIHGNLPALDAVLQDIRAAHVDHVVCCGDIVLGGPDDRACYDRVVASGVAIVRGNTERFVSELGTERANPRWVEEGFGPLRYGADQFSETERVEMGNLPTTYHCPDAPEIMFYHANPQNDRDIPYAWFPDEDLDANYAGTREELFVGGHSHTQLLRSWRGRQIVICGSVGATNDFYAGAQYLILEKTGETWSVLHRNVPYDVGETMKRYEETSYVEHTGPMGRLFRRTVATRTNQVMPFLAWRRSTEFGGSLNEAVDEFLRQY
ncbi:MAG: metallophosphoesterase family protein [Gemmatimonadetes bacterium]|nr:metallophosphoesterase family protein [Gemmatimonadota bacterium]MBT5055490.1 metallophosphoesterase family protein [Gemmatimonadota bacterium]MBT5143371.1 metallophosphoesterase family protein [Gemmatimonadota bacterium]MBT5586695.1 metallophosphoesterase family protein [Gemmatimonadota bacterium]MBT5963450.1 metallophosphoesterase family protein [Gemmatimonadota bacterium]